MEAPIEAQSNEEDIEEKDADEDAPLEAQVIVVLSDSASELDEDAPTEPQDVIVELGDAASELAAAPPTEAQEIIVELGDADSDLAIGAQQAIVAPIGLSLFL